MPLKWQITSSWAVISPCEHYRYVLQRGWDEGDGGMVCFVMLNPSTADAENPDPTITRCIGFAQDWCHSELRVINLYANRTAYPKELKQRRDSGFDVIGPHNRHYQKTTLWKADKVIVAWGANAKKDALDSFMAVAKKLGVELFYLRQNADGSPQHPLYIPSNETLKEWSWQR